MSSFTLKRFTLSDIPDVAVDQTVAHMRRLAIMDAHSPEFKSLARKLRGKTKMETAKNMFDWVVKNIQYEHDPPEYEYITRPKALLQKRKEDCDGMATLLATLFKTVGIECYFKVIAWRIHNFTHVYLTAKLSNKGWSPIDPVLKIFGQQKDGIKRHKIYKV